MRDAKPIPFIGKPNHKDQVNKWIRLQEAALLSLIAHLVAGIAMITVLRLGLPSNSDLLSRLHFLTTYTEWWIAAWLIWNAAALSIVYFFVSFAAAHSLDRDIPHSALWVGVAFSVAALALDLAAEVIEMAVLPFIASYVLTDSLSSVQSLFFVLDRIAVMLTGYAANGLYTIAAIILVMCTRNKYPRRVWVAGVSVGCSGIALSIASLYGSTIGMIWSNAILIPSLLLWQLGIAMYCGK